MIMDPEETKPSKQIFHRRTIRWLPLHGYQMHHVVRGVLQDGPTAGAITSLKMCTDVKEQNASNSALDIHF